MATQIADRRLVTRVTLGVLAFVVAVVLIAVVAWSIYYVFLRGVIRGPSFVDQLRDGTITVSDIKSVEILKFDPGGGWPFSEREYARKARVSLNSPQPTNELIAILAKSTDGHEHRNHPSTFYYGILRIDLVDGGHYYVFYQLGHYKGEYYTQLKANSRISTNPNGATPYESAPLAEFLRRNDPWYRDADSPQAVVRPGFPDIVP